MLVKTENLLSIPYNKVEIVANVNRLFSKVHYENE